MSIFSVNKNKPVSSSNYTNTSASKINPHSLDLVRHVSSRRDDDSLDLAGADRFSSTFMTYGPSRSNGKNGGADPAFRPDNFLDKAANGTATNDDLATMQYFLQEAHAKPENFAPADGSPNEAGLNLQSFLDKVAKGTVTEEDLQNMRTVLLKMKENGENPQGPESQNPKVTPFLQKVTDGTVTKKDLTDMQTVLQSDSNVEVTQK